MGLFRVELAPHETEHEEKEGEAGGQEYADQPHQHPGQLDRQLTWGQPAQPTHLASYGYIAVIELQSTG